MSSSDPEPRLPESPRQFWPPPPPDGAPRPGLARRIAGRTTDLLALAILLIGGLTIGRQVTIWWRDEPTHSLAPADLQANLPLFDFPAGPGEPLRLEFGSSPFSLERQVVAGDASLALDSLFNRVRLRVENSTPTREAPSAGEQRLLRAIANLQPALEQSGDWQVFQLDGVPTAVVGVRLQEPGEQGLGARDQGPGAESGAESAPTRKSVRRQPRVVCWGFLFPFSPTAWTTYLFSPTGAAGSADGEIPQVELPADSRRTLALREAHGGMLVGFQGPDGGENWKVHFETVFKKLGWSLTGSWNSTANGGGARFQRLPDGKNSTELLADVNFSLGERGEWNGLLCVWPAPAAGNNPPDSAPK